MENTFQCPNCSGLNHPRAKVCDYCSIKLDGDISWEQLKEVCRSQVEHFEDALTNYSVKDYFWLFVILIGGPMITGGLTTYFSESIGWGIGATAVSILPFFLLSGIIAIRAENRIFDNQIRAQVTAFQNKHRLTSSELSKLIKEICGKESILAEQITKLL